MKTILKTLLTIGIGMFLIAISRNIFAATIEGTIADSVSGKPLKGAAIIVTENHQTAVSDSHGQFSLSFVENGSYTLKVSYVGYNSKTLHITVEKQEYKNLEIRLSRKTLVMDQIIITATKTERSPDDVPARVNVIDSKQIELRPVNNVDDILRCDAGLNIDRKSGMFSKNSSITMRGMNGSYRTMVLLDGIPLNKADGKGINWNAMNTLFIDRIEVSKGPLSALYGGNAMGGVINVITRMPVKPIEGIAKAMYGSYNSCGGVLSLGGSEIKNEKGVYWGINGFYRRGDGYLAVPDTARDTTDVKMHVWEYNAGAKAGYQFNKNDRIEANYNFYDDKRGDGIQVYDPDGGYFKYTTHNINLKYIREKARINMDMAVYYLEENYFNQKENIKKDVIPKYTLYHTTTRRRDIGFWYNITRTVFNMHTLTAGTDLKLGSVTGSDIYHTSSDTVNNTGSIISGALFLQDEAVFFKNRFRVVAGLRFDVISFFNGSCIIKSPTSATLFMASLPGTFDSQLWMALSPKLGLIYSFKPDIKVYLSYSRGFRAPILDDISRNGNINKGIKLANPLLKPEKLDNIEWGMNIELFKRLKIEPTVYFSIGHDFQYFVGTGDTIEGGNKPKPVLKRENVGTVHIFGVELNAQYEVMHDLFVNVNYAHCHSVIYRYNLNENPDKDLSGKYLMEVAPNQVYASVLWRNKIVNVMVSFNFVDKVWVDDENTTQDGINYTLDAKLSRIFFNKLLVSFGCQNISGREYIDSKGVLGIGRYFLGEVGLRF